MFCGSLCHVFLPLFLSVNRWLCELSFQTDLFYKHFSDQWRKVDIHYDIYLIDQVQGLYWDNIYLRSWHYGSSAATSVEKGMRKHILLTVLSQLGYLRWDLLHDLLGHYPILGKYQTSKWAFWLVNFSYRPSQLNANKKNTKCKKNYKTQIKNRRRK